ncbi:hypothetical protein ACHAXR_010194 [Thalassiosira sp. AJA248-18]
MSSTNPKTSKRSSPDKKTSKSPTTKQQQQLRQPASNNTAAGEYLLERLRILLNRLQSTTEILQNWPETQGDSAKIHADTATQLIASIRKIVLGLRSVERHVNGTGGSSGGGASAGGGGDGGGVGAISKEALEAFRISLEDKCPIPLDLLDLLDVGQPFGLNPQCYARGLMKESMRQLAGLERRKRALDMLATAIETGMDARIARGAGKETGSNLLCAWDGASSEIGNKRKRDDSDEGESAHKIHRTD